MYELVGRRQPDIRNEPGHAKATKYISAVRKAKTLHRMLRQFENFGFHRHTSA